MTDKELWARFCAETGNTNCEYEAWAFGDDADRLAQLVLSGDKTATASAHALYEIENEALPATGGYNVILDSADRAVCITRTEKVYVVPFRAVSAEHAYREGEGDKSLAYWRDVHKAFFETELQSVGLAFSEDMNVVCEEFSLIYKA